MAVLPKKLHDPAAELEIFQAFESQTTAISRYLGVGVNRGLYTKPENLRGDSKEEAGGRPSRPKLPPAEI